MCCWSRCMLVGLLMLAVSEVFGIAKNNTNSVKLKPRQAKSCQKRLLHFQSSMDWKSWKQQSVLCKILRNYKRAVRATNEENGPVLVKTHLDIMSIGAVNEAQMQFTVQFRFRQSWYDSRLSFKKQRSLEFDYVYLAADQVIWIPDTFFQNEKSGHNHSIDQPNAYTRIRYDGYVEYDKRLSMTFACLMNFQRYPHDTQECQIEFASYAYTTKDIEYIWDNDPIQVWKQATSSLPKFRLINYKNGSCTSTTNTGTYSCLRIELYFARVFSYFFLQLYIPSIMLVAVSYVSYWIDWKASPARVPLSIVTLLTMITQSNIINSSLPPVAYIKAIDVWISACIVLIFGSLLEYACVNYTGLLDERRKRRQQAKRDILPKDITETTLVTSASASNAIAGATILQNQALMNQGTHSAGNEQRKSNAQGALVVRRTTSMKRSKYNDLDSFADEIPLWEQMQYNVPGLFPVRTEQEKNIFLRHRRRFRSDPSICDEDRIEEDTPPPILIRNRRRLDIMRLFQMLKSHTRAERIDFMARIVLPIVFLGFNIVYWTLFW